MPASDTDEANGSANGAAEDDVSVSGAEVDDSGSAIDPDTVDGSGADAHDDEDDAQSGEGDILADLSAIVRLHADSLGASGYPMHRLSDPASVVERVAPDSFFEPSYSPVLAAMIRHVVEIEGPVRDHVLARRIALAHGFARTGSRIRDRVIVIAKREAQAVREEVGTFFWPKGQPTGEIAFRRPASGEYRNVDDIAMVELVSLARQMAGLGFAKDKGVAAMARSAGLQRLRAVSRVRLENAWNRI